MGEKSKNKRKKLRLIITSKSKGRLLNWVVDRLKKGERTVIFTPNPEFVVYAEDCRSFGKILNRADILLPDGIFLVWALEYQKRGAKAFWLFLDLFLGRLAEKRVTGVDFMLNLCSLAAQEDFSVFFLGAKEGVAEKAARNLKREVGGKLRIAGCFAGEGGPGGDAQTVSILKKAAQRVGGKIDILFVAYGMGKQERWIMRNLPKVPVKLAIGVGGAFDFYAWEVPRAPKFFQKHGLEWFWRLLRQPWRIKRQIKLFRFFYLIFSRRVLLSWGK